MSDHHYYPEDLDVEQQERLVGEDDEDHQLDDDRTPLDKTIDRIGMGSYQWTLLSLCGFGWMADNMWIQAIAIILPRVQQHYSVPDSFIGGLSSSMFAGMMLGAVGWGTCSDILGRSAAFNATLFFTAVFGLLASLANNFSTLCIALFFLGSAVGGSMPTDGTLLLEHMPKEKQYLVTALSVFFSFGSVLSAIAGLIILPANSCPTLGTGSGLDSFLPCDVEKQNKGWKYLLMILALITLSMFLARIVFFRLHESPRYLVHAGRPHEAIKSLQMISKFNGSDLEIELDDVQDNRRPPGTESPFTTAISPKPVDIQQANETTVFEAGDVDGSGSRGSSPTGNGNGNTDRAMLVTQYAATGQTPANVLVGHSFKTPTPDVYPPPPPSPPQLMHISSSATVTEDSPEPEPKSIITPSSRSSSALNVHTHFTDSEPRPLSGHSPQFTSASATRMSRRMSDADSRRSSIYEYERKCRMLPRFVRKPLAAWWDRVSMVLEPEWFRTTILVWAAWTFMSLAFTMFNVYLPKLLELGGSDGAVRVEEAKTLEDNLWDVVIFTIGGTPGALLGAWLIESSLGRRWSLAGSTFTTAVFCVVFVMVESTWAVRLSTVGISLSATAMWAVLYGWTPEIFGTKVRGSACGIASALSRIGGMIAPLLGGTLLMISRAVPVYTSAVVFVLAGFCVLLLKEGEGDARAGRTKGRVIH